MSILFDNPALQQQSIGDIIDQVPNPPFDPSDMRLPPDEDSGMVDDRGIPISKSDLVLMERMVTHREYPIPLPPWRPRPLAVPTMMAIDHWGPPNAAGVREYQGAKRIGKEWDRQYSKDTTGRWAMSKFIINKPIPTTRIFYLFAKQKDISTIVGRSSLILDLFPCKYTLIRQNPYDPKSPRIPIPKEDWYLVGFNKSEMYYEFADGQKLFLRGADNYESLIGDALDAVFESEGQNCDPRAWDKLEPMLNEKGGLYDVFGTPRGEDHFTAQIDSIKAMMGDWRAWIDERGKVQVELGQGFQLNEFGNPMGWAETLTVEQTKHVSEENLRIRFLELARTFGDPKMAELATRQEYWCDRTGGDIFQVYGHEMQQLYDTRFHDYFSQGYPHPWYPILTAWDLGEGKGADNTVCIAFQVIPNQAGTDFEVIILDYTSHKRKAWPQIWRDWVVPNQYFRSGQHPKEGILSSYSIFPDDFTPEESILDPYDELAKLNTNIRIVPNGNRRIRINLLRRMFPHIHMDHRCKVSMSGVDYGDSLFEGLRKLTYAYDEERRIEGEYHNWASHYYNALATGMNGIRMYPEAALYMTDPLTKEEMYSAPSVFTGQDGRTYIEPPINTRTNKPF